jgi:hypothetical protein
VYFSGRTLAISQPLVGLQKFKHFINRRIYVFYAARLLILFALRVTSFAAQSKFTNEPRDLSGGREKNGGLCVCKNYDV